MSKGPKAGKLAGTRPTMTVVDDPMAPNMNNWPTSARKLWEVSKLMPYAQNARTHSDAQVDEIVNSIRTFGWTVPVLVDELGLIIAGHGRVMAAAKMKITHVPVVVARGWSADMKRAYTIADNKIALNAGWDLTILRAEMVHLEGVGIEPSLLGFTALEMVDLKKAPTSERDPEATPEPPKNPVSKRGDIWLLGAAVKCPECHKSTPLHEALKKAGARR